MSSQRLPFVILVADIVWIAAALYLAYECRYGLHFSVATLRNCFSAFAETVIATMLIWAVLSLVMKLDGFNGGWSLRAVFSDLIIGVFLLVGLVLANGYLTKEYQSRLVFLYLGVFSLAGFLVIRLVALQVMSSGRRPASFRRVVILGGGPIAGELATKIMRHPEMRWRVVGFLCSDPDACGVPGRDERRVQAVRTLDVSNFLAGHKVHDIIVAMANPTRQVLDLVSQCQMSGIRVHAVPQPYELYISKPVLAELDGLPLIALDQYTLPAGSEAIRRLVDLIMTPLVALVALPPLLLAAAVLAVRKGKAFRREMRCGKSGETFWMYRLNVNRDLPILPRYEKLFVELGLTELPQLWNVVRGDMNLVGPRPESPERVKHYSDWQRQRLKIKPGISGLAQIHGLRDEHPAEQKTRYDLQYVLRWSPFLDLSLILQTLWTLVARITRVFGREPAAIPSLSLTQTETPVEEVAYVDHP